MRTATFTLPTVHLNGTSVESLLHAYSAALDAAHALSTALREAAPNARDYYPQGDDAFNQARAENDRDLDALEGTIIRLAKIVRHLRNVKDSSKRR